MTAIVEDDVGDAKFVDDALQEFLIPLVTDANPDAGRS